MTTIDEKTKRRAACEAYYLLNWAVGDLSISEKLFRITESWENLKPLPEKAIMVTRRLLALSAVISACRLKETRQEIARWLLSETELEALGFPRVERFFGGDEKWQFVERLRGYAGHSYVKAIETRPRRIIDAKQFGKALRETGLIDLDVVLKRITAELSPGVENVRNELGQRYPEAVQFMKEYASEIGEASGA